MVQLALCLSGRDMLPPVRDHLARRLRPFIVHRSAPRSPEAIAQELDDRATLLSSKALLTLFDRVAGGRAPRARATERGSGLLAHLRSLRSLGGHGSSDCSQLQSNDSKNKSSLFLVPGCEDKGQLKKQNELQHRDVITLKSWSLNQDDYQEASHVIVGLNVWNKDGSKLIDYFMLEAVRMETEEAERRDDFIQGPASTGGRPKKRKKMPRFTKQAGDHEPSTSKSPVTDRSSSVSLSSSRRIGRASQARVEARKEFLNVTSEGLRDEVFTNPESLPSLNDAYNNFQHIYPQFSQTWVVDEVRDREYSHLLEAEHVCMDYCGFGLFSYYQQVVNKASSSFGLAYISANLATHALYGSAEEGTVEAYIRRRVMDYLNLSDQEYSMVFTVSRGSAFKLLAESYPFHLNRRLLSVYDFESEAVSWMAECAKQKGAKIMSASFKWPSMRVGSRELKKQLQAKKKRGESARGLFVFPVQSRMTGAKYSYQWMAQAQQNKWHVLLDVSAMGPKDMDSLGLSLFRPDFIVSSFYKVFGNDPTGFGCLLIKNSVIQSLHNSSRARAVGMVRIVSVSPADGPEARDAEEDEQDEELEQTSWRLDQQVGVSSFSGPVSSFYTQDNMKDARLPVSKNKVYGAGSDTSGEIPNSGYLRRGGEILGEDSDEDESSASFSGRLRGYRGHSWRESDDTSEVEYSGYDFNFEPVGRSGEIEEEVPKSGSFRKSRTPIGSSSGEIERPRKSLREILEETETSPVRIMTDALLEEDEFPTSLVDNYNLSPRNSSGMNGSETSNIPGLNDRTAGDSDDSADEDFAPSSYRNEWSRDETMYSAGNSEDKLEWRFPDLRYIEAEIEEREFSRTLLSDIEEEKSADLSDESHENRDERNRSDDGEGLQQTAEAEAEDEGILFTSDLKRGGNQAKGRDNREPKENTEGRIAVEPQQQEKKIESQQLTQKETTDAEGAKTSIKARIVKFVRKASFGRRSRKETSDAQDSVAQGHENEAQSSSDSEKVEARMHGDETQSSQRGNQVEEVDTVTQPKPELLEAIMQANSGIRESPHAPGNGVHIALLFPVDRGGTPDEFGRFTSGEDNYITILPGNESENWHRRPETVSEFSDSAEQPDSKSSEEDLPDRPSPAAEQVMERGNTGTGAPDEVSDHPEAAEGSGSSEQDDTGSKLSEEDLPDTTSSTVEQDTYGRDSHAGSPSEVSDHLEAGEGARSPSQNNGGGLPDTSCELPSGEHVSAPVYSEGASGSGANTSNNDTSNDQGERGHRGDGSFAEAESSHDVQDQRGMNGNSQDLRSGRPLSRDVEIDDDMFISSQRRLTLAEDIARLDLQGSDEESYYQEQYYSDSYQGSSTPRSGSIEETDEEDENGDFRQPGIVFKGLDLADSLGLTRTNLRLRYLVNWLVNSLLKLRHPSPNSLGNPLVRIYGPKVKYDRGAAVAFNLVDWKGKFIQPLLVQRLADRHNIALGVGRLCNIVDPNLSPDFLAEKERWFGSETSDQGKEGPRSRAGRSDGGSLFSAGKWDPLSFPVVTAALSFITNFEDVYRLWAFIAKFLDADFVSKEMWKYHSLNQQTVIV
ncbi:hypothetical protein R1sor_019375 [Riccia sorocarpa]|uniref:Molybdenum cofactor sulfurase n=1 Tax=Riccia sorocarpa TaxID=122646 RepID=A0ABD3ICD1_9MARC